MDDYVNVLTMLLRARIEYESEHVVTVDEKRHLNITVYDDTNGSLITFTFSEEGYLVNLENKRC